MVNIREIVRRAKHDATYAPKLEVPTFRTSYGEPKTKTVPAHWGSEHGYLDPTKAAQYFDEAMRELGYRFIALVEEDDDGSLKLPREAVSKRRIEHIKDKLNPRHDVGGQTELLIVDASLVPDPFGKISYDDERARFRIYEKDPLLAQKPKEVHLPKISEVPKKRGILSKVFGR